MSFRNMQLRLLSLLTLAACGGAKSDQPTADTTAAVAPVPAQTASLDGKEEYLVCQACHGENGAGMPGAFPPLAGSEWVTGDARKPIAIILHGLQGPINVNGVAYNGVMASWSQLSDEQIAAILTYERSSWGNTASPVTAAEVAAVRKATEGRTGAWTVEELEKAAL
jgi:mono/diheme cytochrome c family protein